MNKLIAVEFSPVPRAKDSFKNTPICGAVGETFTKYLDSKSELIPVRFPLVAPGSYRRLLYNRRDPLDETQLLMESVIVPRAWLHRVSKTPVSLYTETKSLDLSELLETSTYLKIVSKWEFLDCWLPKLSETFSNSWYWKKEWTHRGPLFVEGRIYGIDTVIPTYDYRQFSGVAVQVIVRQEPTHSHSVAGIKVLRCVSDVILFSKGKEFISYLDGVEIPREVTTSKKIFQRYMETVTPEELRKQREELKQKTKAIEEKKDDSKHYYVLDEAKQVTEPTPLTGAVGTAFTQNS